MSRFNEYMGFIKQTKTISEDVIEDDALEALMSRYKSLLRYVKEHTSAPYLKSDVIMAIHDFAYEVAHVEINPTTAEYVAETNVLLDIEDFEV